MSDERLKQLIEQAGMQNSASLYGALQQAENEGFQSGATSRDAEIQRLQFALADSEALELGTAERCDQLRAQINVLRDALAAMLERFEIHSDSCIKQASTAIASTTEQSLAEYRNKVIEECAAKCKDKHVNGNWMYDYREECEAAILDMKEQP